MESNKILISINKLEDINEYKKIGITNFLFALENYSIGYNTFSIEELRNLDINVYLNINIIMDTQTIESFKKIVPELNFVKGIFFEDVGLYRVLRDDNINLYWNQAHFVINSRSINFWLNKVSSAVLSNELTIDEIKYIITTAIKPVVLPVYGHNISMYSRRYLLAYFNKYKNPKLINNAILSPDDNTSFLAVENRKGTALFYNKPFNYIPYLDNFDKENIKFYYIDSINTKLEDIIKLINGEKLVSEEKFLNEKTIYKLGGKND